VNPKQCVEYISSELDLPEVVDIDIPTLSKWGFSVKLSDNKDGTERLLTHATWQFKRILDEYKPDKLFITNQHRIGNTFYKVEHVNGLCYFMQDDETLSMFIQFGAIKLVDLALEYKKRRDGKDV
jgi:hypothetical protein